jgi:hypothetical protein
VIADMLQGSQNKCAAGDFMFLPRIFHVLDQMHPGGCSAAVDASKCLHQLQRTLMIAPSLVCSILTLAFGWNVPVCQWEEQTVRRLVPASMSFLDC